MCNFFNFLDSTNNEPSTSATPTFEELLLKTVRTQKSEQKQKRKRVDTAEIITKEDYLEKVIKQKEETLKTKKNTKTKRLNNKHKNNRNRNPP